MEELAAMPSVAAEDCNRCQYDQGDGHGSPVKKPTRWMSNSAEVLKKLGRRCQGRGGACSRAKGGVHVAAQGSVTRGTAIYPFSVCKAILQGFRNQMVADGRLTLGVVGLQRPEETMEMKDLEKLCAKSLNLVIELNKAEGQENFVDAITGQPLRADLVRAARREEMEYFAMKKVWLKVPREMAFKEQGRAQ